MKYVLCLSLMITSYLSIQGQESLPCSENSSVYYEVPAWRYRVLGSACKPMQLTAIKGPCSEEVIQQLRKTTDWFNEKIVFFLKHKHLSPDKRQALWEKLEADPRLKQQHDDLQRWLAQKAQEPLPTKREDAVPKAGWRST